MNDNRRYFNFPTIPYFARAGNSTISTQILMASVLPVVARLSFHITFLTHVVFIDWVSAVAIRVVVISSLVFVKENAITSKSARCELQISGAYRLQLESRVRN